MRFILWVDALPILTKLAAILQHGDDSFLKLQLLLCHTMFSLRYMPCRNSIENDRSIFDDED